MNTMFFVYGFLISLAFFFLIVLLSPKRSPEVKASQKTNLSTDSESEHRRLSKARFKRMNRHKEIWAVLRYMTTYKDLVESNSFYAYKDCAQKHIIAAGELRKMKPTDSSIETAIRFCQLEKHYGTCDYHLTDEEILQLKNWENNKLDPSKILQNVVASYQEYWDDVLKSYVRPTARIKRLEYLIEDLDGIIKMPELQEYHHIISDLEGLQNYYRTQLENKQLEK